MQLAKVVIASALVLAACGEGLPEGKGCVLKCISDVKFPQTVVCILKLFAVQLTNCCVFTMCNDKYSIFTSRKYLIHCLHFNLSTILHTVAGALHRPQRSADTQSGGDNVNTSSFPYIEVLRGRDGRDGRDGVPGPRGPQGQKGDQGVAGLPGPRNGGVVYTRWGKSSCPSVSGTTLVYAGRAGGTYYSHKGLHIKEEQPTTSVCLIIQTTSATNLEFKGRTMCMEQSTRQGEDH